MGSYMWHYFFFGREQKFSEVLWSLCGNHCTRPRNSPSHNPCKNHNLSIFIKGYLTNLTCNTSLWKTNQDHTRITTKEKKQNVACDCSVALFDFASRSHHITSRQLSQLLTRCLMYISWRRRCCEDVKVIHDCRDPSYSVSENRWPELRAVGRHCVVCVWFFFLLFDLADLWIDECAVCTVLMIAKTWVCVRVCECVDLCVYVCMCVCVWVYVLICVFAPRVEFTSDHRLRPRDLNKG